jgi:hypothetical protein
MTRKQISTFEALQGQLQSFHQEFTTLTKKSPNDAVNKFKLGLANATLRDTNTFLGNSGRPFASFDQFNEESLPTNSDVLMIISQF